MSKDYVEELLQSVDTIVSARLGDLAYDRTIVCTIVDSSEREYGKYTVTDGSTTFEAYSDNNKYSNDIQVQVVVPSGDWSAQKIIVGRYISENSPITYRAPTTGIASMSDNLVDGNKIYSLAANEMEEESPKEILIPIVQDLSKYSDYDTICVKANFKSTLGNYRMASGSYGIIVEINGDQSLAFTLDSSRDMFGSVYDFVDWTPQECIYKIPNEVQTIESIQVWFYQRGDFSYYTDDGQIQEIIPMLNSDKSYVPNLFVQNINIYLGSKDAKFGPKITPLDDDLYYYPNKTDGCKKRIHLEWNEWRGENTDEKIPLGKEAIIQWFVDTNEGSLKPFTPTGDDPYNIEITCARDLTFTQVQAQVSRYENSEENLVTYKSNILKFENYAGKTTIMPQTDIKLRLVSVDPGKDAYPCYDQNYNVLTSSGLSILTTEIEGDDGDTSTEYKTSDGTTIYFSDGIYYTDPAHETRLELASDVVRKVKLEWMSASGAIDQSFWDGEVKLPQNDNGVSEEKERATVVWDELPETSMMTKVELCDTCQNSECTCESTVNEQEGTVPALVNETSNQADSTIETTSGTETWKPLKINNKEFIFAYKIADKYSTEKTDNTIKCTVTVLAADPMGGDLVFEIEKPIQFSYKYITESKEGEDKKDMPPGIIIKDIADEAAQNQFTKIDVKSYLTQENIFNALTEGGTVQGLFKDDAGNLYINGSYIATGILRSNTWSGTLTYHYKENDTEKTKEYGDFKAAEDAIAEAQEEGELHPSWNNGWWSLSANSGMYMDLNEGKIVADNFELNAWKNDEESNDKMGLYLNSNPDPVLNQSYFEIGNESGGNFINYDAKGNMTIQTNSKFVLNAWDQYETIENDDGTKENWYEGVYLDSEASNGIYFRAGNANKDVDEDQEDLKAKNLIQVDTDGVKIAANEFLLDAYSSGNTGIYINSNLGQMTISNGNYSVYFNSHNDTDSGTASIFEIYDANKNPIFTIDNDSEWVFIPSLYCYSVNEGVRLNGRSYSSLGAELNKLWEEIEKLGGSGPDNDENNEHYIYYYRNYSENDEEYEQSSDSYAEKEKITINHTFSSDKLTNSSWKFKYWTFGREDDGYFTYKNGDTYTMGGDNLDFYAQWEKNEEEEDEEESTEYTITYWSSYPSVSETQTFTDEDLTITLEAFGKTKEDGVEYTCIGFDKDGDGDKDYDDGATIDNPGQSLSLTVLWKKAGAEEGGDDNTGGGTDTTKYTLTYSYTDDPYINETETREAGEEFNLGYFSEPDDAGNVWYTVGYTDKDSGKYYERYAQFTMPSNNVTLTLDMSQDDCIYKNAVSEDGVQWTHSYDSYNYHELSLASDWSYDYDPETEILSIKFPKQLIPYNNTVTVEDFDTEYSGSISTIWYNFDWEVDENGETDYAVGIDIVITFTSESEQSQIKNIEVTSLTITWTE